MVGLIALVVVVCLVLLLLGVLAPRLSRRLQGRMDRDAERGEEKAERSGPAPLRRMTEGSLEASQHAADRASEAGRHGREEVEREHR